MQLVEILDNKVWKEMEAGMFDMSANIQEVRHKVLLNSILVQFIDVLF